MLLYSSLIINRVFLIGIPGGLQLILFYSLIPTMIIILNFSNFKRLFFNKFCSLDRISINYALFIGIIFSIITPYIYGTNDFTYLERWITSFIYLLGYLSICVLLLKFSNPQDILFEFIKLFINVMCLYVFVTIIFYLVPSIKDSWFEFFNIGIDRENFYEYHKAYSFRIGWSGFSGFGTTFLCSIGIAFSLYMLSFKNKIKFIYIKILILLLGNAFYGRIGILVSSVLIILYFLIDQIGKLQVISSAILLFVVIIGGLITTYVASNDRTINIWFNWILSPFVSLIEEGTLGQKTMFDMYFIPEMRTFLFGDGLYTSSSGGYYMNVDIGFMRPLLFYGIFLTVIPYTYIIGLVRRFLSNKKNISRFIIITIFSFELKGEVIFSAIPIVVVLAFLSDFEKIGEDKNGTKGNNHYASI